jgi:hydrogenase expression/formation protein HypD
MTIDERFSDPTIATLLKEEIEKLTISLNRTVRFMEVCGTHTVALRRHGIHSLLPDQIKLISGPGCPVCVTPSGYIDNSFYLVEEKNCTVVSFGDMAKVPGVDGRALSSLLGSGRVRIVYSPSELSQIAKEADGPVVFLAIGFETTIPTVIAGFRKALDEGRRNVFLYTAFKTVPAALQFLLGDSDHALDGFILPGHVSVVIGSEAYRFLESDDGVAGVITGFEPIDMLGGIKTLLELVKNRRKRVINGYRRAVRDNGNPAARAIVDEYLEPYAARWRSVGVIEGSGLRLRREYRGFDAAEVFGLKEEPDIEAPGCLCGAVIQGKVTPPECAHFGSSCTPDRPVGPCMVSSEGTCAAYLKYGS